MKRAFVLASLLALTAAGCPRGPAEEPASATPADRDGPAGEAVVATDGTPAASIGAVAAPPPDGALSARPTARSKSARSPVAVRGLTLVALPPGEAEDGAGVVRRAEHPVALDVYADAWPGRARDPVLVVGPLRFRHYHHPAPGVLRFVIADRALLPAGAEVSLDWGDDPHGRVVVTPALAPEAQP